MDKVTIRYATFLGGNYDGMTEELEQWEVTTDRNGTRYQCTFRPAGSPYCVFTPSPLCGSAEKDIAKALYENTTLARRLYRKTESIDSVA